MSGARLRDVSEMKRHSCFKAFDVPLLKYARQFKRMRVDVDNQIGPKYTINFQLCYRQYRHLSIFLHGEKMLLI